jgi:hypothetical protein
MAAGRERPLGGPLNRGPVRNGIGEGHADFDHVRSAAREREQNVTRTREIGIAGGHVGDEPRPGTVLQLIERSGEPAHRLPAGV